MATRLQYYIPRYFISGCNPYTFCARTFSSLLGQDGAFDYAKYKRKTNLFLKQNVCEMQMTWCQRRGMAGHSHWQNIRHIKGARDAKMANVAAKTMNNIFVAVKAGGGDPKLNRDLAKAIEVGINQGITRARVMEMVDKCVNRSQNYQKTLSFVTGPQGCVFVVEAFTDNINRIRNALASVTKKTGGKVTKEGKENFDEKGVIEVPVTAEMEPVDMDKYLEIAIEVGAEDVILVEEENADGEMKKLLKFHCNPGHIDGVKKGIESYDLEVTSAESDFIPLHWITLEGADLEIAQNIYQKISQYEEVSKVFDNISTPDE